MRFALLLLIVLVAACQAPPATKNSSEPASASSSALYNEVARFPGGRIIDLTHTFEESTVYWPTADLFEKQVDFKGETPGGYWYESNTVRTSEHGGTHLDAPVHFAEGRHSTDQVPLERLIGPAIMIDVSRQCSENPDYLISTEDIIEWESAHGEIASGSIVLLRTDFSRFWPDREAYMGTSERGADAVPLLHFPGLDPDAARWLVENRSINALGIDTPSIDYGQSEAFFTHQVLFADNIPAFENVASMTELPATGFHVIALPMKIGGGSGGPLRIVAIVP